MWNIVFVILIVLILICMWIVIYDSNRFVIREYVLSDQRIKKDCKIVVLADLHNKRSGRENELLISAVRNADPDMILIAGDMLTAKPGRKFDTPIRLLGELVKDYPVYYANGNHEHRLRLYPDIYGDMAERYEGELEKLGIRPLVNEHVDIPEYGIIVYGSQIDKMYYSRFAASPMSADYLNRILGRADRLSYSILLAHNPEYFAQYADWGADLTLSGHVHGGVVRVPLWGKGVISPRLRFFPRYDGGRFEENGRVMLVSRGLGMHTIPFRLFNPAELLVLDLKAGDNDENSGDK